MVLSLRTCPANTVLLKPRFDEPGAATIRQRALRGDVVWPCMKFRPRTVSSDPPAGKPSTGSRAGCTAATSACGGGGGHGLTRKGKREPQHALFAQARATPLLLIAYLPCPP